MATAASTAGFVDLCAAFMALYIFPLLDPQLAADPAAQAALLELLLPLAAFGVLASASTAINHHLKHSAGAAGAAGRTRCLYRLFAVLCAAVGILEFSVFVYPAGVGGDVGAQARALGVVAARVLPAAASATFFLGMALIIVAHIRAGGEGGGGADGQHIQGAAVSFLTKAAYAAAAALAWLVAIALLYGDTAI